MKRIFRYIGLVLCLLFAYLFFWPSPVTPETWKAPVNPTYSGQFAKNQRLAAVDILHLDCPACEDVAIDSSRAIYGAAIDGRILRFDTPSSIATEIANTGGRPLGLDFDDEGNLYIADAVKGLIRLTPQGLVEVLSTEHEGRPYGLTDDLEVGSDGKVYFSDASDRWFIHEYKLDILEHTPNGRLLVYDPVSQEVELLLDSLYFANGIAVSADASFVLVNETSSYRILKHGLSGSKKGQTEVFIDNLPAFPDGISSGSDGIFWLAMVSPRNPIIDDLSARPFFRKIIARLPEWAQPAPEAHVGVLGLDATGKVIYNFQDPAGKFSQITSVQQWGDDLYFGSLVRDGIGVLKNFRAL